MRVYLSIIIKPGSMFYTGLSLGLMKCFKILYRQITNKGKLSSFASGERPFLHLCMKQNQPLFSSQ